MKLDIDISGLESETREAIQKLKEECLQKLSKAGKAYVTTSQADGNYNNHTYELRRGNGYQITYNGKVVDSYVKRPQTADLFNKDINPKNMILTYGNGTEYASYVQRKGYDVTDSGQLAAESVARNEFSK